MSPLSACRRLAALLVEGLGVELVEIGSSMSTRFLFGDLNGSVSFGKWSGSRCVFDGGTMAGPILPVLVPFALSCSLAETLLDKDVGGSYGENRGSS